MSIHQIEQLIKESSYWNWDDDRGEPIDPKTWSLVKHFLVLARSIHKDVDKVHISPCGDGSVHLTWFSDRSKEHICRGIFEIANHRDHILWSVLYVQQSPKEPPAPKDIFEELKNIDQCLEKLKWFFENYG